MVFSELGENPFVTATAARYNESSQSPGLLKFTIVYLADDISGLEMTRIGTAEIVINRLNTNSAEPLIPG